MNIYIIVETKYDWDPCADGTPTFSLVKAYEDKFAAEYECRRLNDEVEEDYRSYEVKDIQLDLKENLK